MAAIVPLNQLIRGGIGKHVRAARYQNQRTTITEYGQRAAGIVPPEDLDRLDALDKAEGDARKKRAG